jgi:hypothetical protein
LHSSTPDPRHFRQAIESPPPPPPRSFRCWKRHDCSSRRAACDGGGGGGGVGGVGGDTQLRQRCKPANGLLEGESLRGTGSKGAANAILVLRRGEPVRARQERGARLRLGGRRHRRWRPNGSVTCLRLPLAVAVEGTCAYSRASRLGSVPGKSEGRAKFEYKIRHHCAPLCTASPARGGSARPPGRFTAPAAVSSNAANDAWKANAAGKPVL